jgi:hypothetical protein
LHFRRTHLPEQEEIGNMNRGFRKIVSMAALVALGGAGGWAFADYPIMDAVAGKVIKKYQSSTCEQLWAGKAKPKTPEEQRVIAFLRQDPGMRQAFFDKIAGPVVNKMFECGMIP